MASFLAAIPVVEPTKPSPLPDKVRGRISTRPPKLFAIPVPGVTFSGRFQKGAPVTPPPIVVGALPAALIDSTPGGDWFGKIHVLPRSPIDFGSFVTPTSETVEVFNSHDEEQVLVAVVNTDEFDVNVVGVPTLPASLLPHSSLLASGSVPFVPVLPTLVPGEAGAASFSGTVTFTFASGEEGAVTLFGERVPVVLAELEGSVIEVLEFGTSVMRSPAGPEQRLGFRRHPRQSFEGHYTLLLDSRERRTWSNLVFGRQTGTLALPLWHVASKLTAAASAGATTVTVTTTVAADYRVGGRALVFGSELDFDVVDVTGVTATTVTFAAGLSASYPAGTLVAPIRLARLPQGPSIARFPDGAERHAVLLEVTDAAVGASDGTLSGWSTFRGKLLLDAPNVMVSNPSRQSVNQPLVRIDSLSGEVFQRTDATRSDHGFAVGFVTRNRSELQALRDLLLALGGSRVSFWAPARQDDLVVTQDLASGTTSLIVENDGYAQYVGARVGRAVVRITFTDTTVLDRDIVAAAVIDEEEEELAVDIAWPENRTVAEIASVRFLELVRFDSDSFRIEHFGVGQARLEAAAIACRDVEA